MMKSESKIIAVKPITNSFSMVIYEIRHGIEDKVVFGYSSNPNQRIFSKLRYDGSDEGVDEPYYFVSGGKKHYLNEFMRVEV